MSKLKKLALISVVLLFIVPIFVCLYSTLIFGNSFVEQQWFSALVLALVGLFILGAISPMVIDGLWNVYIYSVIYWHTNN